VLYISRNRYSVAGRGREDLASCHGLAGFDHHLTGGTRDTAKRLGYLPEIEGKLLCRRLCFWRSYRCHERLGLSCTSPLGGACPGFAPRIVRYIFTTLSGIIQGDLNYFGIRAPPYWCSDPAVCRRQIQQLLIYLPAYKRTKSLGCGLYQVAIE
jgi:hypothetical protein